MKKTELIRILTNKITQLDHKQRTATEQPLKTRFAPHLFSENNQVFSFYFQELKQTLIQLENAPETDITLCAFFAEKLLSQYVALSEALTHTQIKTKTFTPTNKATHHVHQLPPRERLEKYYEALQALNEKLMSLQDSQQKTQAEQEKKLLGQKIQLTQQRKAKCLAAIETLEEYLVFKNTQDKK
ncbi:TPA: primosomal replication protein PriC [Pasteurella multocida]|uniref:primosomal replication protein PriC n=1 Tax=Pasteurella multocida TaxID=747 RepID=UPI00028357FC|nr:primosomal replication protein PriC [Pasteurella multocida]ARB74927.1 primosomal replication protein N [Pasteurella multocida]EJZ79805.1 Primosomal replication protein N'' [Pasteurella multocida subsp. gallicida P1059]NMR22984.1 primosomal replication protein N [Pasteurella multocida]NMR51705.1 primosomal replication protein N [Pasteurella multocida]NMR61645.1 primosomal replication protein N [Pasteurella multocida]